MKHRSHLTLSILCSATTLLVATSTAAAGWDFCLKPYVGVDAQMRHMHFQKHFGGNILQSKYPQANIFAGLKFNEYVGIEVGYEFSKKQQSAKTHNPSDKVFGQSLPLPLPGPETLDVTHASRASSKINGFNLNLVGFLPILCEEYKTQLVGSIGIASLKSRSHNTLTETETTQMFFDPVTGSPTTETATAIRTQNIHYAKRKTVLRLSGGVQHMITDCIGIRALVTRESTAKIHAVGKDSRTGRIRPQAMAKLKNSFSYSLGIFTSF